MEQLLINNPGLDPAIASTDARLAVGAFTGTMLNAIAGDLPGHSHVLIDVLPAV